MPVGSASQRGEFIRYTCRSLPLIAALTLVFPLPASAEQLSIAEGPRAPGSTIQAQPVNAGASQVIRWDTRTQAVGKINVGWSNAGGMASEIRNVTKGGCYDLYENVIEFPKGSHNRWSGYQLWIGGIKGEDTVVSTMEDAIVWPGDSGRSIREVMPAPPPEGDFIERTSLLKLNRWPYCQALDYDELAISEHDLISSATDTITDPNITDINPFDQRRHKPLGLRITCRRYAWSYDYAEDFVLVEYELENVGIPHRGTGDSTNTIKELVLGVLVDGTVLNDLNLLSSSRRGSSGDVLGRISTAPLAGRPDLPEPFNMIWAASVDGDPLNGQYDQYSETPAFGLRILKPGLSDATFTFNWWIGNRTVDGWGPVRQSSKVWFVSSSNLGRPETDRGKYQLMTNGEVDYPQVEAAVYHEGWLPPPSNETRVAGLVFGLLSFGPYRLELGDKITFALALVGGDDFHTNPQHHASTWDPSHPEAYLEGLNFDDLIQNARWAGWLYDSPGKDTDGDGFAGDYYVDGLDTIYYGGDGVPDFSGPPPPPSPSLSVATGEGALYLRWNGYRTETTPDPFLNRRDFEGYRVYMSRTGRPDDWSLLAQRDLLNYARYTWNRIRDRWEMIDPPFTRDSLKAIYDSLSLLQYGYPFEPDSFPVANLERAFLEVRFDEVHPDRVDSSYRYFGPYEANSRIDDRGLAAAVESGHSAFGTIRKVYPESDRASIAYREDGSEFAPFFEYEYAINGLQIAEPIFVAVTAFDHGDPATGFKPLESSKVANGEEFWPINSADVVKEERPKPGVYPNPYRISDYYNAAGWENPRGLEPDPERARKVTFTNVPDTCTVSIWSIDGDLVRRLEHRADPSSSEATVVIWDLITRNTQAVKTGIYIYAIESRFGTDVGKLVIIK